jgi:hypothetical protein
LAANNLTIVIDKMVAEIEQLGNKVADDMLKDFNTRQSNNEFWINRTGFTKNQVKTGINKTTEGIDVFIENPVEWANNLEYANDRRNAHLEPMMKKWTPIFLKEVQSILKKDRVI